MIYDLSACHNCCNCLLWTVFWTLCWLIVDTFTISRSTINPCIADTCRYRCHKQHWPQPRHYVFQRFFERVVGRCEKQPGSVASTTSASLHTPMYSSFSMLLFHRSNQSTTEFSGRCLEIRSVHERNFFPCHVHREHPSHCVRGHPPRNQRMADTTTVGVSIVDL